MLHTWVIHFQYEVNQMVEKAGLQLDTGECPWTSHEREDVSNHLQFDCLVNNLFRLTDGRIYPSSRMTAFGEGNPPVTGGFPSQRASNAETISWRHRITTSPCRLCLFAGITYDQFVTLMTPKMLTKDDDEEIRQTFVAFDIHCKSACVMNGLSVSITLDI